MKNVLITGVSRGIGLAAAEQLLATNEYVIYGLARTATESSLQARENVFLYDVDLANSDQTQATLETVMQEAGGIDVLINNAGIGIFKPVDELTLANWQRVMNVGLTAPFIAIHSVLPHMKQQNWGRIVTVASDAARISYADASAYCAAKAGVSSLMDCVRKEVAGTNINLTTIAPGRVDTYFNNKQPGARPDSLMPEDVAAQIVHVLSLPDRCEVETILLNSSGEKQLH